MKNTIKHIIYKIIMIISIILIMIYWFYVNNFKGVTVNQLLFHLQTNLQGTNTNMLLKYTAILVIPTIILYLVLTFINKKLLKKWRIGFYVLTLVIMVSGIVSVNLLTKDLKVNTYLYNLKHSSTIYDDYYVDPQQTTITFPETKRNLVYIVMESMETTYESKDVGGMMDVNLIPYLTKMAQENISFSSTDLLNGGLVYEGTNYTMASLVSQTSGIPFHIPSNYSKYNDGEYLPGVYTLGEVLADNGYNQVFMCGSDLHFADRDIYFRDHGNYEEFDYDTAIELNKIPEDYHVFWGYEDAKLYEYAKEKVLELAAKDEPFNFTMLTVDTHFEKGYLCDICEEPFDDQYTNVIYCADDQVNNFINWLKAQDFYDNTTIVIQGDHPSMGSAFFKDVPDSYVRTPYNVFINSAVTTTNTKNRLFSVIDNYPTTLASLGATIDGERLGLGTNLFSDTPTLMEELGQETFISEIEAHSNFYDDKILFIND